ncbi:MAG: type II toxin-antitoxin system RelE/ParE family toxin [Longimicrobiales bacterium]|nr:type II toxin-antitoxin system RelE/ParE family toxin [Longimicrobiales bacterium]
MIRSFRDLETKAIFEGGDTNPKDAKRARRRLPTGLWERARAKLDQIDAATGPTQLTTPSNRLRKLSGDRAGQWSVRINRQYRVCFEWKEGDAWDVEIVDYHE